MNVKRTLADLKIFSLGYLRNPIGLFFSLAFPIILIVLFGAIFANSGHTTVDLYTQNFDHNSNASRAFLNALNATGAVHVILVPTSAGNLSHYLVNNSDPVGLVLPQGFDDAYRSHATVVVTLITDPQDATSSGIVEGAVQGVINGFNLQAVGGKPIISASAVQVGSQIYSSVDYLVPGLIGFSILTSPMFAMVDISSTYRKEKLFRQLSLTPLTKSEWLASKIVWFIVLTLISVALMVTIGVGAFGAHVRLTLAVVPFLLFGPFFFVSLGMLAGSVTRTPETAAVIGNVITFPMMFLSGTFFPVSLFSPPLQTVAHALPLYYVIDGMNQVMLFNNTARAFSDLIVVVVGAVVIFIAAIVAFRWRDE